MKLKNYSSLIIPILIFLLSSCTSCTGFKPVEMKKVESVKILTTSAEGIDMEVNMIIRNPNIIRFTITEGDLNLVLNKVDMGKAELKNQVTVPANSEISQKFIVHVGLSSALVGGFASLLSLFKSKSATITIQGTIRARSFGISHSFPLNETAVIPFSY
jgi:LEA14-like dessication related protein